MERKYLFIVLILLGVLKIIDVLLTIYGLSLGGIELNPFGFNVFSLSYNFGFMVFLGAIIFINKDVLISKAVFWGLIVTIGFHIFVISHNILEVI